MNDRGTALGAVEPPAATRGRLISGFLNLGRLLARLGAAQVFFRLGRFGAARGGATRRPVVSQSPLSNDGGWTGRGIGASFAKDR